MLLAHEAFKISLVKKNAILKSRDVVIEEIGESR